MKRIITFAVLALSLIAIGACSEDTYVEKVNSVQVVSGKTEIAAGGGENKIVLNLENCKAKPDDEWLGATVSGNTLTISADINPSKESRNTYVTVTAENGDFITIPVTQLGVVVVIEAPEDVLGNDDAHSYEFTANSNLPMEVSASEDWIHVSLKDGILKVDVDKNTTGALRSGTVTYTLPAASISNSFNVAQADFDRDIVGKYYLFAGTDLDYIKGDSEDEMAVLLSQLVKNGSSYSLVFPQFGWTLPVKVTTSTLSFTLPNGTNVGTIALGGTTYYSFAQIADYAAGGYVTTLKTPTMTGQFLYDPEIGFYCDIVNNGSWSNYNPDSYAFFAYRANSFTSANRVGYLIWMVYPFLLEYSIAESGENTAANFVKPMQIRKK